MTNGDRSSWQIVIASGSSPCYRPCLLPRATQMKNTSNRMVPSALRLQFGATNYSLGARASGLRSSVAIATRGIKVRAPLLRAPPSVLRWDMEERVGRGWGFALLDRATPGFHFMFFDEFDWAEEDTSIWMADDAE